jgi:DNA-binding MarR family transcriptional regulator
LRNRVASLLGVEPEQYRSPQMTYDLTRLLRKGLIRRFRGRHRYVVTDTGRRVIAGLLKVYRSLVRPSFPAWSARQLPVSLRSPLTDAFDALDRAFENMARNAGLRTVSQI